ncbi:MAG TPA: GDP-mannose 4,6-dehydratase [Terriglobales bacterium]|nr:GDP-mannose 4,6-dehydratase [Terriglobales bacterium]
MNLPRVLLTGGAGFIGSHLAEALLTHGYQLSIIDNLDNFYEPSRKKDNLAQVRRVGEFEFFELDICEFDPLREAVRNARPDIIVHLAARAGVRPSIEQPSLYERVNVAGTVNLLELARELHVNRVIFGSSSSVYGATNRVPFSEDDPVLHPISPYAATKLAAELMGYTYASLYGIHTLCLRFFTVYGPRQRPDLAIHKFTALMEAGRPIPVYGDGSMGRDYTYVDDIVAGVLSSLEYRFPLAGVPFDVFNLGNSHPVKLAELIEYLEAATGHVAIRDSKPLQPGDVPLTWANIDKSFKLLGYRPQTRMEDGLRKFVAWYRGSRSHGFGETAL